MKFLPVTILSFLLFAGSSLGSVLADNVRISGNAPGYEGAEIIFYTWTDKVTFTEIELARFTVDENGDFSVEIEIDQGPLYIFANSGVYLKFMYIEPGINYRIVFPERIERSARDYMNPYFEGVPTHIAVINGDSTGLNHLISSFDSHFEPLFGEPLLRLAGDRDHRLFDSLKRDLDARFDYSSHPYFDTYRNYKFGLLQLMAQLLPARSASDKFFRDEPVHYSNVAYMEMFNQVYNRYFLFFSRTIRGNSVYDDINRYGSLKRLRGTLASDMVLGDDRLLELVILKGLHDAFYGSDFSRSGLLTVLDSLAHSTSFPEHERIAGYIREKVTRLMTGFKPVDFSLRGRDGERVSMSGLRGSYIYLNFCTAVSYGCLSEYEVLNNIRQKHEDHLKIVTVFIDESYEAMLGFLARSEYDWDFLFYGDQPSILKDYDVRMFPTYYLLDRDGTLLLSPAPSPAEDFEKYLLRILRSRGEIR